MTLRIDPARKGKFETTGIYVRALDGTVWVSADIADLDRESLIVWLRSRGGDNTWAENVVAMLLGHAVKCDDQGD